MGSKDEKKMVMTRQIPFKWRHFEPEVILLCVRWYLRYSLSYRDLEEIMAERGLSVDHTTIYDGCSGTPPNWRSAVGRISKERLIRGA